MDGWRDGGMDGGMEGWMEDGGMEGWKEGWMKGGTNPSRSCQSNMHVRLQTHGDLTNQVQVSSYS